MPTFVDCPHCAARVEWRAENRYRPFCSERCKKIDLGAWAAENYRVPDNSDSSHEVDETSTPSSVDVSQTND